MVIETLETFKKFALPPPSENRIKFWDKVAEESYFNFITEQERRLAKTISSHLNRLGINAGHQLLELGSGNGHLSCLLTTEGFDVSMADFSKAALNKSKMVFAENNAAAQFYLLDIFRAHTLGQQFDVTWNSGVMEHFTEKELLQLFSSFAEITQKYYLCIVPNPRSLPYLLFRYKAMRENQWLFGTEFLRENYTEIAESAGWSLAYQCYLGMEYSIDHMNYFIGENNPLYHDFVQSELVPESEAYLTLYVYEKKSTKSATHALNTAQAEFKTLHFDFLAEMQKNNSLLFNNMQQNNIKLQTTEHALEQAQLKYQDMHLKYQHTEQQLHDVIERLNECGKYIEYIQSTFIWKTASLIKKIIRHSKIRILLKHLISAKKAFLLAYAKKKTAVSKKILKQHIKLKRKFRSQQRKATHWSKANAYRIYLKLPGRVKQLVKRYHHSLEQESPSHTITMGADVLHFINRLENTINKENAVFYVQPTILNFYGTDFFCGGAERYAIDLNNIFPKKGYDFYCIQYGSLEPWIRYYYGLTIIGLPEFTQPALFQQYVEKLTQNAKLLISSPFGFLPQSKAQKSIGISHGIYWDTDCLNASAQDIADKAKNFDALVSVDTATLNFIRSHAIKLANKINFIPNYVDHEQFYPQARHHERIVILYPRRLYTSRGFWTVQRIAPQILREFAHVDFLFCGKGDEQELKAINKLISKYPGRVTHLAEQPDKMHQVYAQADIVLIPTIHSEGTSLSLIEAMACKKAIISTYVGGLSDLVTNEFNGLMIKPDDERALYQALKKLITDEALRNRLAHNAYEKSKAFSIQYWQENWLSVIASTLEKDQLAMREQQAVNFSMIHLPVSGISFDKMVQRPQQLFKALAKLGIKCFFMEETPGTHQRPLNKNLVISARDALVDYTGSVVYTYYATPQVVEIKCQTLIYDVLDAPQIHQSAQYVKEHEKLLARADIILTSSYLLYQQYIEEFTNKIVKYLPNAAHGEDFHLASRTIPHDFLATDKKIIGYYGAIAEWFDYSLLDKMCSYFQKEYIILIGPCRKGFAEYEQLSSLLEKHRNLLYLGVKRYEELPAYAAQFDVSIIPFNTSEVTKHCSPVKLFEYMNVGAPIVSSNMPECRKYQSVMVAENHEDFIHKVEQAFKLPKSSSYFEAMREEAQQNTWASRAQTIIEAINQCRNK